MTVKLNKPLDIKAFHPYLFGKVLIERYVDAYITERVIIFMPTLPKVNTLSTKKLSKVTHTQHAFLFHICNITLQKNIFMNTYFAAAQIDKFGL